MATIQYIEIEPASLHMDVRHQVNRWRHNVDWWSGKILSHVSDKVKAAHAVEQVRVWTERLAAP